MQICRWAGQVQFLQMIMLLLAPLFVSCVGDVCRRRLHVCRPNVYIASSGNGVEAFTSSICHRLFVGVRNISVGI